MRVVHPHQIAWRDMLRQRRCKGPTGSQLADRARPGEIAQADSVVHCWLECPIGETIVVFLTVKRRQVHERVLNIPFVDHSGLGCRMSSYLTAPAEPETFIGLTRLSQCNGQASSGPFTCGVGNRYTVRNNDEARQRSAPRRFLRTA